ncbi:MAG TPA: RDD family protein [Acidimicrobiales bacterium]|nr:RDD family protein [Acidimicrobiales bacterium]
MTTRIDPQRDVGLQGHYAGIVTRTAAFAVDVGLSVLTYLLILVAIRFAIESLTHHTITWADQRVLTIVGYAAWAFLWFAYPWSVSGKSLGMAIVGVRVVRTDGSTVGFGRAAVRAICLPFSILFFGLGVLLILVQPERRALHDLIAGTAVVYSWNARAARLRFLAQQPSP